MYGQLWIYSWRTSNYLNVVGFCLRLAKEFTPGFLVDEGESQHPPRLSSNVTHRWPGSWGRHGGMSQEVNKLWQDVWKMRRLRVPIGWVWCQQFITRMSKFCRLMQLECRHFQDTMKKLKSSNKHPKRPQWLWTLAPAESCCLIKSREW